MAKLAVCIPVLLLLVLLVALSESRPKKVCCTKYQKNRVAVKRLESYVIQQITGYCNIEAVIFKTVKNRQFCADPRKKWVIKAMESLPQKYWKNGGS